MPPSAAANRRGLIAILAGMTFIGINVGLFHPLVALNLEARGVSTTFNGLIAAMPYIAAILTAPFLPRFVARLGLLGVLFLAGAIDVGAILLFTVFDNPWSWLLLRFILGIGMMFHWIGSEIWVNAAVSDAHRGKIVGLNGALFSAGMACGPLILGELGTAGSRPFLVSAGLVTLAMTPLLFAFGAAPIASHKRRGTLWASCLAAPTPMVATFVSGIVVLALFVQLPIYGLRSGLGETDAVRLLSALVIGGMVAPVPIGWLSDHVDRRRLLVACGVVILACALILPWAFASPPSLWLLLFVWGGAGAGLYTLGMVRLGQVFGPDQLSAATAAFIMITHMGSIAGPLLIGGGMDLWNPDGFVVATVAAAALFVAFGTYRLIAVPSRPAAP
ncbi:MAG: MFS transporter [Alphaproteobacteria bacterium]|nr:MFS transporter [Alphaproteobacteria bacterium]